MTLQETSGARIYLRVHSARVSQSFHLVWQETSCRPPHTTDAIHSETRKRREPGNPPNVASSCRALAGCKRELPPLSVAPYLPPGGAFCLEKCLQVAHSAKGWERV